MSRIAAVLIAFLLLIAVSMVSAQEATPDPLKTEEAQTAVPEGDLIAYVIDPMTAFVPIGAQVTTEQRDNADGRITQVTAAVDDGLIRYVYYESSTLSHTLYDLLAQEMLAADLALTLTTYEQVMLYGRLGWRVDGVNANNGWLARGRVGWLPNEGVLISIATAPDERLLARRADAAAYGVAFSATGTPYMPAEFPPQRLGSPELMLNTPVQGYLDAENTLQAWTFNGHTGERVSFAAVDLGREYVFDLRLDMAIRILNPDGSEFGSNDDQVGTDLFGAYDALLAEVTLPVDGIYTVQVEWVQGAGWYTLGVSGEQALPAETEQISGTITNVFTFQRWLIDLHQGDQITLTTQTSEGSSLDPMLELLTPDGRSLAFNDDAENTDYGIQSRIEAVTIPADGTYVIEVGRYEGVGSYEVLIETNP